jgi:cell division protein ZapA
MAEENRDKLHIRLHVYDRDISVIVPRDEEEYYRNAAKLITDTVNTYAQVYKGKKSDLDLVYMALIDISLRFVKESKRNDTAPYCDILSRLTSEIEEVLKA